ncbi:phosphopantetheine-binding protein, partial [Pseudoalteromonas sp. McH1-42]
LAAAVPHYMMPQTLTFIDEMPLTPNGKVDSHALLRLTKSNEDEVENTAQTSAQILISNIWRQVLHLDHLSINDNFFALGGHSVLAVRILSKVQSVFKCNITLRQFFIEPNVLGLTNLIEDCLGGSEIVNDIAWVYDLVADLPLEEVMLLLEEQDDDF